MNLGSLGKGTRIVSKLEVKYFGHFSSTRLEELPCQFRVNIHEKNRLHILATACPGARVFFLTTFAVYCLHFFNQLTFYYFYLFLPSKYCVIKGVGGAGRMITLHLLQFGWVMS